MLRKVFYISKKYYLRTEFLSKMDLKKSIKADLEHSRTQFFIVSIVISLSFFYVLMEYNSGESDYSTSDDEEENAMLDEIMPISKQKKDELEFAPIPEKKIEEHPTKLNPVKNTLEVKEQEIKSSEAAAKEDKPEADAVPLNPEDAEKPDAVLNIVQELPEFPGGIVEMLKFFTKNLRYPPQAQNQKIQGTVTVQFVVNTDGTIVEQTITQKLFPDCDREAMRVMRLMPKWKPGKEHGKPVRVRYQLPIVFRL